MPLDLKPAVRVPFERLFLDPNNPRLGGARQPGYDDPKHLFDEKVQGRLEARMRKSYKSLKTILDGGLEGRPENVLFYATSNRRHLMPRDMIENERSTAINPGEAVEEKVSLSDRFGLWLGFHNCDQPTFLAMVHAYADHYGLDIDDETLKARAIEWAATRGARSGRVAIQLVRTLAGELGKAI